MGGTASLGIASFPEEGTTLTSLLHASDKTLYQAKASGRNRFVAARRERVGGQTRNTATALPLGVSCPNLNFGGHYPK